MNEDIGQPRRDLGRHDTTTTSGAAPMKSGKYNGALADKLRVLATSLKAVHENLATLSQEKVEKDA